MTREQFLIKLMPYLGIPYIWGGDNPNKGLDCSGFVQCALAEIGLDPKGDQSAAALYEILRVSGKPVSIGDLGCLAFFGPSMQKIIHVGLCLDERLMIEAGGGGSKVTTPDIALRVGAKVRVAETTKRSDFLLMLEPSGLPWKNQAPTAPIT